MILSNEPGYYKEGAYGIRLENLIVVDDARRSKAARSPCTASRRSRSPPSTAA
jgi:Xaa-Pro aminopeptidase